MVKSAVDELIAKSMDVVINRVAKDPVDYFQPGHRLYSLREQYDGADRGFRPRRR